VRRWIGRFNTEGSTGLADRPGPAGQRWGGRALTSRIAALLERPGPQGPAPDPAVPGWPQVSARTLYRTGPTGRDLAAAEADRPRGDPDHDHVVTGIVARLMDLLRRAVVLAEDETQLNLLPHVRASWMLRGARPQVFTLGHDPQGHRAIEVSTGHWVYRLGRRCAADFIALLDQVLRVFPSAPAIVVICDNDSIHHAGRVTAYLEDTLRLELLYGARYSPHDNPAEMGLPQCELCRSSLAWLPGSLSFEVPIRVPSSVQRRRLW
jgi:hypothetical protein